MTAIREDQYMNGILQRRVSVDLGRRTNGAWQTGKSQNKSVDEKKERET
jgi:hypothetical protein